MTIYVIPIRSPNREFVCKMYAKTIRGLSKLLSMRVSELRKGSSPATSIFTKRLQTLCLSVLGAFLLSARRVVTGGDLRNYNI